MVSIREVVHLALTTGYLTVVAENQLRQLLTTGCDQEDLNAFITLQLAAMDGWVRQESRELSHSPKSFEKADSICNTGGRYGTTSC